ncbi:MAG: hypothetical protein HC913_05485 [Microscillaceae bacterium]|nr:hypothetical protein [Microscillaceae bacterium]
MLVGLQAALTPAPSTASQPYAYLRWQFLAEDQAGQYRLRSWGFVRVPTTALNAWRELSAQFTAPENGLFQVFVANESDKSVWFDDLQLTHSPALLS